MHIILGDWQLWQRAAGLSERTIAERAGVIAALHQDVHPRELPAAKRPKNVPRPVETSQLAALLGKVPAPRLLVPGLHCRTWPRGSGRCPAGHH